jgi:hypothetical protein
MCCYDPALLTDERPPEVQARLDAAAKLFEEAAHELDRAARHCRVSAERFTDGEVPSGTAHAWAAFGHVREALEKLEEQARVHRTRARLAGD